MCSIFLRSSSLAMPHPFPHACRFHLCKRLTCSPPYRLLPACFVWNRTPLPSFCLSILCPVLFSFSDLTAIRQTPITFFSFFSFLFFFVFYFCALFLPCPAPTTCLPIFPPFRCFCLSPTGGFPGTHPHRVRQLDSLSQRLPFVSFPARMTLSIQISDAASFPPNLALPWRETCCV
eukprot:RCo004675